MLGAIENLHVAADRYRLGGEHDVEIKGCSERLPACHAVTDADAIGLSPRLDAHSAAGAPAFMDAVRHPGFSD